MRCHNTSHPLDTHAPAYNPARISSSPDHKAARADTDHRTCIQRTYASPSHKSSCRRRIDCNRRRRCTPACTYCRLRNIAPAHKHRLSGDTRHTCSTQRHIPAPSSMQHNRCRQYIPQHTYCPPHSSYLHRKHRLSANRPHNRLSWYYKRVQAASPCNRRPTYTPMGLQLVHPRTSWNSDRLHHHFRHFPQRKFYRTLHTPENRTPKKQAPKETRPKPTRNKFAAA